MEKVNILQKTGKALKREYLRMIGIGCLILFSLLPLVTLLFHISGKDLRFVFKDANFFSALGNSLLYSLLATIFAVFLALMTAYFLNRSSLKGKPVFVLLLTLGMLVPSLSIGLGIRTLFGKNGFLSVFLGIEREAIGMTGLVLGAVIVAFPSSFLILYDALRYEDKRPYDAAEIMGISRISTFFKVTLPYLKMPLISAFFAGFTLVFSDYGVPMEVAGKIKTLPMYLYEQVLSSYQYGRGAIAGTFLLLPAVLSFVFDFIFKETTSGENNEQLLRSKRSFNILSAIVVSLVAVGLFLPQLSFIALSVFKAFPKDLGLTLSNFKLLFTDRQGLGLLSYLQNSLFIACLTGVVGTIFAYFLGYLSVRKEGKMGKIINFLAMSTIAIPGIVLGIGYIFLFSSTRGYFYGTVLILMAVNIFHFIGSPYLMAKNCLSKINKDYELIGETLGISKIKIIFKVVVANSIPTLLEMFSYLFLNSMITISAVAFLCTYSSQPLSILINVYEKNGNYEMQATISVTLLIVNVLFKTLLNLCTKIIQKSKRKKDETMQLTRYEFDLLTYLEKNGKGRYTQRFLSNELKVSVGTINKIISDLLDANAIQMTMSSELEITEQGLKRLEPYKVRKAIIFAAGFGSRMAPVTLDTPKPLVKVNGVRMIDTLLDALVAKGIKNITIVRGYKKEKFNELLEKYPFLQFVDNDEFNVTNNISSAMKVVDIIDRCYICEADLLISNPEIIRKYEYTTNYLGAKVNETDDWCFKKVNGYIGDYKQGGEDCYQAYGISFWNEADSNRLKADLKKLYLSRGGKEYFWEACALKVNKNAYKIQIRNCHKSDIVEIDNFSELVAIDASYADYPKHGEF